ncbi:hypothetical protein GQ53DRAFT_720595 [Thozetella sp. PMI_491]|nr:hypothetical protein GQ53DRAFT_720595 [Thozetella sp. PMI_491]
MVEAEDIQNLLQTGSWSTSRAKSPKPSTSRLENYAPVRANQSSKLAPQAPRSFNYALHKKRFPPPPTVEDEADSLAREHGSTISAGEDEEPKFRGDVEQNPILMPVHEHNPERRFVWMPNASEDSEAEDSYPPPAEKRADYEANTGRKVATPYLGLPGDGRGSAKPGLERKKSHQDLPQIKTDLRGPPAGGRSRSKSNVTVNQQPQEPDDYFNRRDEPPQSDGHLSPVIKHSSKSRRDRSYYYDHPNGDPRTAPVRDDRRGPPPEERWSTSNVSRSPMGPRQQQSAEPPKYTRHMSEQGRYEEIAHSNGRRRDSSPPPQIRRKHSSPPRGAPNRGSNSPPYPQSSRESRESLPSRTVSHRRRHRSPVFEEDDGYISDDRRSQRPPRSRRSTMSQDPRSSMLMPDSGRPVGSSRPRSKATTPVPSPRVSQVDGFGDGDPPRSPRSATFPGGNSGRHYEDDRPVSPFSPVDEAPRSKNRLDEGNRGTRPRAHSRATSNATLTIPTLIPIPVPISSAENSPVDSRRPPLPPPHSRNSSFEDSPPRQAWQPAPFNPAEYRAHLDKPIQSYRRHSEDVQQGIIPKLPECPRRMAQPGFDDWLTIARAENFDICPACYNSVFALTDFKHDFIPAPARPIERAINCDFGSSIWYRIAFLMTIKHGYNDLRLLKNVAAASARYTPCAGANNDTRVWYSIIDPHNRRPISSFTVCHCCARTIEALFPNLASVFMPVASASEPSRGLCSMHYTHGRLRFDQFVDLFETTSDRAMTRQTPPDLQWLADKIREKSLDDECMRNRLVVDQKWHVMEAIPQFTVCAECFDTAVWPIIEGEESTVARNFLQQKQRRQVASCQLYSERMRDVFRKACRRNDMEYLEDKVGQRTRAMKDLQMRSELLKKQDPNDPQTREGFAEIYRDLRQWE